VPGNFPGRFHSAFNFSIFQKIIPSTSYAISRSSNHSASFEKTWKISRSRPRPNHRRFWKRPRDIYRANNRLAWTGCFLSRSERSRYASNVEFSCIAEHTARIGDIAWLRKSRSHVTTDSGTIRRVLPPRSTQFSGATCNFAAPLSDTTIYNLSIIDHRSVAR